MPPHLAGREAEQKAFAKCFEFLRQGVPPARPVVLYGPRGNGKTALLHWVEQQVEADPVLDADWLTPSDLPATGAVAPQLEPTSWLQRLAPDSVSVAGVGASVRTRETPAPLAKALQARARSRPFVLLLDEAHMVEPEVGRLLLNAAQIAGSQAPFLLVLAGTPDLPTLLSRVGASFWSRSKQVPLGRLNDAAAAEAIRVPLEREGIEVEDAALARIVEASHGYPYFVQVWGSAVWEEIHEAMDGDRRLNAAVVDAATEAVRAEDLIHATKRELRHRRDALLRDWEMAKDRVASLQGIAEGRLSEVKESLDAEISPLVKSVRTFVDQAADHGDRSHFFRRQIIEGAKSLEYFANLDAYRAWVRLVIKNAHQSQILISFHGIGHEFHGVLVGSAVFFERAQTSDEDRETSPARALADSAFQINYKEDPGSIEDRFRSWIEGCIVEGLRLWRLADL